MAEFKRKHLQNFVDDGAKDHPPVFIGHEEILAPVLTKARRAGERQLGPPGNAIVIQGALGAGKSSVLSQLEIRAPMDVQARVVKVSSVYLEDHIPEVVRAIALPEQASKYNGSISGRDWVRPGCKIYRTLKIFKSHLILT